MQNEMRDRLVELLINSEIGYANYLIEECDKAIKGVDIAGQLIERLEFYADQLIENGVVAINNNVVSPKNRPLIQTIADMPLNEVIDLIEAKQEGRIIVPPCKVGDTVYIITTKHPCYACNICTDFCHKDCRIDDKNKQVVKRARVCSIGLGEINKVSAEIEETKISSAYIYTFWFEDFGKTVFLTKDEAEKALKEGADNG